MEKSALISLILELRARLGMVVILQKKIEDVNQRFETFKSQREQNERLCRSPLMDPIEKHRTQREAVFKKEKDDALAAYENSCRALYFNLWKKEQKKHQLWKSLNIVGIALFALLFPILSFLAFMYLLRVQSFSNVDDMFLIEIFAALPGLFRSLMVILLMIIGAVVWTSFFVEVIRLFKFNFPSLVIDREVDQKNQKNKELKQRFDAQCAGIRDEPEMKTLYANYLKGKEECKVKFDTQQRELVSQIQTMVQAKQTIYQQTQKQFSSLIGENDWIYLDQILYFLVSNRADTLKEALNLVDSQMHHAELLKTIQKVGEYVTQTISKQISQLGVAFQERMDHMDQKVLSLENNLDYKLNLVSEQMQMMQQQHIEAIEGLRYTTKVASMEFAREAREGFDKTVDELRYIGNQMRE